MATDFTPFASTAGGALIGLAAVLLMLGLGRVMGATGILTGTLFPENRQEFSWRAVMICGMIVAPLIYIMTPGTTLEITIPSSPLMISIGGLLVGFGAGMGSGCTSGHGVCGLSRLSVRSMVAVPVFMSTATLTVYLVRHGWGS